MDISYNGIQWFCPIGNKRCTRISINRTVYKRQCARASRQLSTLYQDVIHTLYTEHWLTRGLKTFDVWRQQGIESWTLGSAVGASQLSNYQTPQHRHDIQPTEKNPWLSGIDSRKAVYYPDVYQNKISDFKTCKQCLSVLLTLILPTLNTVIRKC